MTIRELAWLCALAMLIVMCAMAFAQEHEHGGNLPDWYDPSCCNQRDCRPVADDDIEFRTDESGQAIVFHRPTQSIFYLYQFRKSQDERYHVCINTISGAPLCVYIRPGV